MRPAARAALTAGSVILVGLLALGVRSLSAYGVFTDLTPGFAGTCRAIPSANGPEDIAIDEQTGLVFVSAFDRRAKAAEHASTGDGLYVFALKDAAPHLTKLAGTPSDFHPHGISLVRTPDGALTLMAIDHRGDGSHSVEIFDVGVKNGAAALTAVGSIEGGGLISPNAVAALDHNRFYVANDHGSRTALGRLLDDLLVLPRADIQYFDGNVFRTVAKNLAFPSGLALSADGRFLYATASYDRRVIAYARQPLSGSLEEAGSLAIPSNVDNLRFDASGNLWVGSHPKGLAMGVWQGDPSKPAPSEVFRVTLVAGLPTAATPVYTNLGEQMGGSSVGAVAGHRLLIGSPLDDHILDCTMDH